MLPPGMRMLKGFLPAAELRLVTREARALMQEFDVASRSVQVSRAKVPQPSKLARVSKEHNLSSAQEFVPVRCGELRGEYFRHYGEDGHQLLYLRGNRNMPEFARDLIIPRLEQLEEVRAVGEQLDWKQTLNVYKAEQEGGFAWHVDIPSNGDATTILTLDREATMQLRRLDAPDTTLTSVQLVPGSLALLSGEARWDWAHRVVPQVHEKDRVSLVYGCRPRG